MLICLEILFFQTQENLQLLSNLVAVGSKILCQRFRIKSNFVIPMLQVL